MRQRRCPKPLAQRPVPSTMRHLKALFDPDLKGYLVFLQPLEPGLADEFTVGDEGCHLLFLKQGQKQFQDQNALVRVGVPGFGERKPEDGISGTCLDDGQHQQIQVRLAKLPIRAIQGQRPTVGDAEQLDDQARDLRIGQLKVFEEAAATLIVGVWLGRPSEDLGNGCQIDRAGGDERDQKTRQKLDPRSVPV